MNKSTGSSSDFFILLRAGLWQKSDEQLSANPDWQLIYTFAAQQAVVGLVADGISVMGLDGAVPAAISQQFIADTSYIFKNNLKMMAVQTKVCRLMEEKGLEYVVLKGQGVAQAYPKPLLHFSGDIDLLLAPQQYEAAKMLLMPIGSNANDKAAAGEFVIHIDGVIVELHSNIYAGINDHCAEHFPSLCCDIFSSARRSGEREDAPFVPSADFDAVYLLVHTIRHLGSFGISLRQIADWTMHMHRWRDSIDMARFNEAIDALHLRNLYTLFAAFAYEYLDSGVPASHPAVLVLWDMVEKSGNFGCLSKYKNKRFYGRVHERLYRTYFLLGQSQRIRRIDPEFADFLKKREFKGFSSSIIGLFKTSSN